MLEKDEKFCTPEIRIRNLDPKIYAKLKEMAKQQHKPMGKFLIPYLAKIAALDEVAAVEDQYASLVLAISEAIAANTQALEELSDEIRQRRSNE